MGQGYSLTTLSAAAATIDVPELADLVHEKTLASARFMKSIRARNQQGFVFVKAVMKPHSNFDISKYVQQIVEERAVLAGIPNALGYQRIVEVSSGGFLVRQFINNSVYDRLSTRPFLEEIEKKWLAFQLLCAVRDCHAQNVYHGDIKSENLLVTSWNWLYLTDFSSSFKPVTLPEDNPADFSFYFDTSSRRTCYLAPERFTVSGVPVVPEELNWAMDMFSVGCTIAEMFLEGPIFSLSQIFKYRSGDYSPEHTHLNKIEDIEVREMILNMIELDPEKRYSAEQHLSFYRGKIYPDYFYSFLHQYMHDLTDPSSGRRLITLDLRSQGESDEKIDRVFSDFDKVSYFLGYSKSTTSKSRQQSTSGLANGSVTRKKISRTDADPSLYDGTLLFLTIVVASIRNTSKASARLKACDLLVSFAERLPDEAKLDRILPYLTGLLTDRSDIVKVAALRAMTAMLETVEVVSPINAYVFPEYLFPKLRSFVLSPTNQPSALLRAIYASCLASLALSSARILDMVQAIRADGRLPSLAENDWAPEASYHGLFDVARAELVPHFEEATKALITDPDPSVRRAFLGSVSSLCVFFGSSKASDVILSYLNTYLNDKDWILKCSFYDALVGVAAYVGSSSLERFILPIMIQSLTDPEQFVVEKVLRSLARMASLGLLQKVTTWELTSIAVRFLVHPSSWVRESAAHFVANSSEHISSADKHCIVMPLIRPFLKSAIMDISEELILGALRAPLPRQSLDMALGWARRSPQSSFWEAASRDSVFALPDPENPNSSSLTMKRTPLRIPPSQKGKEDVQPLETLHALGMTQEDDMKLMALREYIYKVAHHSNLEPKDSRSDLLNNIVPLTQIEVTPQNVFFDSQAPIREVKPRVNNSQPQKADHQSSTITDALLEASTSISDEQRRPLHARLSDENGGSGTSTPGVGAVPIPHRPSNLSVLSPTVASSDDTTKTGGSGTRKPSRAEGVPSSDTERLSFKRNSSLGLKHRNSAINLMKRTDTSRADAETSTTSENAIGKLDGPLLSRRPTESSSPAVAAEKAEPDAESRHLFKYEPNHSYQGTDPNVLRLLENHFIDNFPVDEWDFGHSRPSIDTNLPIRRATDPVQAANDSQQQDPAKKRHEPWHPTGQLLTLFAEHTAAINRVVAAPDHFFFVTASDDGSCKIWDTTRLEKNITPRSRHTHKHATGSKVKALCFVDHTHTFISAADDGSIHAVRVDYKSIDGGESTRYGRPSLVRDWQIPRTVGMLNGGDKGLKSQKPEHAVWLYHYRTQNSQSVLLVATTKHRILAVDLKTMDIIYTMSNPIHHGMPTTFCVDKKHHWLLLATTHGILDLWDLRFRLRLRSFGIQTSARIDRLLIHPNRGHGKSVLVSAGGEISIWDVEKCVCKEVYRPSSFTQPPGLKPKPYESWFPDDESSEKILERFAKDLKVDETLLEPSLRHGSTPSTPSKAPAQSQTQPPRPITALATITDTLPDPSHTKISSLLSGGFDRTLRFWDLSRPELSRIVSGPQLAADENNIDGKIRAKYVIEHPLSVSVGGLIGVVAEVLPGSDTPSTSTGKQSGRSTPAGKGKQKQKQEGKEKEKASPSKPPRNTVISAAAQHLLRTHMDGIMDVVVLRKPYGCVVSVDRGGCVFVFQ